MSLGPILQDPVLRAYRRSLGLTNPPWRGEEPEPDDVDLAGIDESLRDWRAECIGRRL